MAHKIPGIFLNYQKANHHEENHTVNEEIGDDLEGKNYQGVS
jgi:hypothetical protein